MNAERFQLAQVRFERSSSLGRAIWSTRCSASCRVACGQANAVRAVPQTTPAGFGRLNDAYTAGNSRALAKTSRGVRALSMGTEVSKEAKIKANKTDVQIAELDFRSLGRTQDALHT